MQVFAWVTLGVAGLANVYAALVMRRRYPGSRVWLFNLSAVAFVAVGFIWSMTI